MLVGCSGYLTQLNWFLLYDERGHNIEKLEQTECDEINVKEETCGSNGGDGHALHSRPARPKSHSLTTVRPQSTIRFAGFTSPCVIWRSLWRYFSPRTTPATRLESGERMEGEKKRVLRVWDS